MRRKLDLAAGLTGSPSVLFLDEPTTGLDLRARRAMWDVIADLVDSGVSVLLTTQYLEEADQLAGLVVVIDHGAVVAQGTPGALKGRVAGHRLDLTFAHPSGLDGALARLGCRVVASDRATCTVGAATDGSAASVRALLDEVDPDRTAVREFAVHTATMDDVFLALTGQAAHPDTKELIHV
jgi:ABC-2 type transport system ATP-binding protein